MIVDLFRTKMSLRKKEVDDSCESKLGEKPPTTVYAKVMKELAYSSGGQWLLSLIHI